MNSGNRQITSVYHFANGMTVVFDQHGQQMPEYQGKTDDVRPKILAAGYAGHTYDAKWPRSTKGQNADE